MGCWIKMKSQIKFLCLVYLFSHPNARPYPHLQRTFHQRHLLGQTLKCIQHACLICAIFFSSPAEPPPPPASPSPPRILLASTSPAASTITHDYSNGNLVLKAITMTTPLSLPHPTAILLSAGGTTATLPFAPTLAITARLTCDPEISRFFF